MLVVRPAAAVLVGRRPGRALLDRVHPSGPRRGYSRETVRRGGGEEREEGEDGGEHHPKIAPLTARAGPGPLR
ncbi:MAG: hypothetical protein AAGI91_15350 [Bacteroidota bacterium]